MDKKINKEDLIKKQQELLEKLYGEYNGVFVLSQSKIEELSQLPN